MEIIVEELDEATSDLETAKLTLKAAYYKWATIQACSSMFHAARSLLYRMGYREESRRGLLAALYQLYEREIVDKMLQNFSHAMTLEERLHNGQVSSEASAKRVLENATDFLEETARILSAPREWFERPAPRHRKGKKKL